MSKLSNQKKGKKKRKGKHGIKEGRIRAEKKSFFFLAEKMKSKVTIDL